jgi:hypothetical protein
MGRAYWYSSKSWNRFSSSIILKLHLFWLYRGCNISELKLREFLFRTPWTSLHYEANSSVGSQEISCLSWNPKLLYWVHICSLTDSSWSRRIKYTLSPYFPEMCFNIILTFIPWYLKWLVPVRVFEHRFVCISHIPCAFVIALTCLCWSSNAVWWRVNYGFIRTVHGGVTHKSSYESPHRAFPPLPAVNWSAHFRGPV